MNVILFMNHACNLSCKYCYNGQKFFRSIDKKTLLKGVELAFGGESATIGFFGGEPLIEFDKIKIAVAHAHAMKSKFEQTRLSFTMTTNGTLLDVKKADWLLKEKFQITLSLDGCRRAHDATRRFPNDLSPYDIVVENLKMMLAQKRNVRTLSIIDPANVAFVGESFDALWDTGVRKLYFGINYEADWTDSSIELLKNALSELQKRYLELYRAGEKFSFPLFDTKVMTHLKGGYACSDRCKFGQGKIAIAPSGRLYPCERLVKEDKDTDLSIGNIQKGIDFLKVFELKRQKDTPDSDCAMCALRNRCNYWCGCVNYALTGDVGKTSGIFCRFEQLIINAADQVAGMLFEEKNPLFLQRFYRSAKSEEKIQDVSIKDRLGS